MRIVADTINANSSGNVHVNSLGVNPVTFASVTGGASFFQVLAKSAITVSGPINSPNAVWLEVISGSGGITINSTVGTSSSNTTVITDGPGTIMTGAGGLIRFFGHGIFSWWQHW